MFDVVICVVVNVGSVVGGDGVHVPDGSLVELLVMLVLLCVLR